MNTKDKFISIYFQLVGLFLISAIVSLVVFFIFHYAVEYCINNYIYTQDYEERRNQLYIKEFQKYIDENELESKNYSAINTWVKKQKIISISIYQDRKLIFNSYYPDQDYWSAEAEYPEYEWEKYYGIQFADGPATVSLMGKYEYQLYNYALVIEIMISVVCFISIVIIGIRKKIKYIKLLSHQISILENGGLDCEITIKGQDELALLADGLEKMRVSFNNIIEQEADMVNENKKNISEMSHDLRTPVTAVLLFIEILKKEKFNNTDHIKEYVDKIEQRMLVMKQLTTNLFRYSLNYDKADCTNFTYSEFKTVFYDRISEMVKFINENGIKVSAQLDWKTEIIKINSEYIGRILDNISSNIIKYADRQKPVEVQTIRMGDFIGVSFSNAVTMIAAQSESYGVGVQSIINLINLMDGKCEIIQEDNVYGITILFPVNKKS